MCFCLGITWFKAEIIDFFTVLLQVMSSTSMAARVSDEVAEFDEENTRAAKGSPLISLPPPPPFRDAHFHVSIIRNLSVN